jgi:hypothetical protein
LIELKLKQQRQLLKKLLSQRSYQQRRSKRVTLISMSPLSKM